LPELPEVQTVVNSLLKLKNKEIINFSYSWDKVIYNVPVKKFKNIIKSQTVNNITRKGKYIIIHLKDSYLICHLRMTGYLYISKNLPQQKNHIRGYFTLNNKEYLIFQDVRKFGGFYYYSSISELDIKIGLDPFDKNFTKEWLNKNLKRKKRMMKHLLLDQKFICGLGNIYVDEILWKSKIHPKTNSQNIKDFNSLHFNIISTLKESIDFHGTTIINFKFDNMKTGNYKNKLMVYGRNNLPCNRCSKLIIKRRVAGRGTYICIYCQK